MIGIPFLLHPSSSFPAQILALEREVDLSFELWRMLAEQVQGAPGSPLAKILSADDRQQREQIITRVDELIAQRKKPAAAKWLREVLTLTWDEARAVLANWTSVPARRKRHWLRIVQMQRAFAGLDHAGG